MAKNVTMRSKRCSCKLSYACVAFLIGTIMLLGLLSTFRSDTRVLESEVASVLRCISEREKELRALEREATAMMSPAAVHGYAARELGMAQVRLAGSIRPGAVRSHGTATASLISGKTQH